IHPIKDHFVMKRLYLYYKNLIHDQLKLESTKIYRELKRIGQISSTGMRLGDHIQDLVDRYGHSISFNSLPDSLTTWKYFSQKLYTELSINPKKHIEKHIIQSFNRNIQEI